MNSLKTRAFTLIELLTVIAIIGILAAILIPVVGTVRESARASKCISNIRQSGMSLYMFMEENHFQLATAGTGSGITPWPAQLVQAGIVDSQGVFHCPSAYTGLNNPDTEVDLLWAWRAGFGLNMFDNENGEFTTVFGSPGQTRWVINYNNIPDPTRYILLADTMDGGTGYSRFRLESTSAPANGAIHLRHGGRANVFFLDGHVEACDPARLGELGMVSGFGETTNDIISFPQN